VHATSLRGAKNGIFQRARLFRFNDGDSAHCVVVKHARRVDWFVSQSERLKKNNSIARNLTASTHRHHAHLSRAAGSRMLASAAPRRSSFARSSSLARPCSSGSTTPSAGISNCHARKRTKRDTVSLSPTRGYVTTTRIDLARAARRFTTTRDDDETRVFITPVKPRSDLRLHPSSSSTSFTHPSRVHRHAPVGLEHRSSLVLRASYPSVGPSRCDDRARAVTHGCVFASLLELEQTFRSIFLES